MNMYANDKSEARGTYYSAVTEYLSSRDLPVIAPVIELLKKTLKFPDISSAEIASVTKVLHVFEKLPRISEDIDVTVMLKGPTHAFGDHRVFHGWTIGVAEKEITVSGNGAYFYGDALDFADNFTSFSWEADPSWDTVSYSDYVDTLDVIDDAQPFHQHVAGIDFSEAGYELEIEDAVDDA